MNYINEFDPMAAAWIAELRDNKLIPPCEIDTRSIEDVTPADLAGFRQCHFFAGIAGWPLALQLAGIPADYPIWTGSCPCQPFSAAGKGDGFADERHLWPAFHWLIEQCRPPIVVGEQVASAAVNPWLDLVLTDLETLGFAVGAYAGPAAGVGAPHIRDRTYWVGYADHARLERLGGGYQAEGGRIATLRPVAEAGEPVRLADGHGLRLDQASGAGLHDAEHHAQSCGGAVGLADAERFGIRGEGFGADGATPQGMQGADRERQRVWIDARSGDTVVDGDRAGPVNGHWRAADWLGCRDGKWRPVESGTFPLAHGLPARVGRLRGYGNAIVPQQAAEFLRAAIYG